MLPQEAHRAFWFLGYPKKTQAGQPLLTRSLPSFCKWQMAINWYCVFAKADLLLQLGILLENKKRFMAKALVPQWDLSALIMKTHQELSCTTSSGQEARLRPRPPWPVPTRWAGRVPELLGRKRGRRTPPLTGPGTGAHPEDRDEQAPTRPPDQPSTSHSLLPLGSPMYRTPKL